MPDAIDQWLVGDVRITRIAEMEMGGLPPSALFVGLTHDRVLATDWLVPDYAGPDGSLRLSNHCFVIESDGKKIVVDTCVGNDKQRTAPNFDHQNSPFLARLSAAGFPPESIDFVLCTHMHVDHVGWNTRWDGLRWAPTFPSARYLFGRTEWAHFREESIRQGDIESDVAASMDAEQVVADSIRPVIDAGLADFVESDHRITRDIALFSTPGHTPGHVSVLVQSEGCRAVIGGDVIHHPIQIADRTICATVDTDRRQAQKTRSDLLDRLAGTDALLLGTHFPAPSGGLVTRNHEGWKFAPYCGEVPNRRDGAGIPTAPSAPLN